MAESHKDYENALEVFKLQLDCVVNDDREKQMGIHAEDLRYEFPFANDRPNLIEGRDTFKKVMEPIWERRRKNKRKLSVDKYEFHATDEAGLFLAVFALIAFFDNQEEPVSSPYVQLLRIHNGYIVEVREYFGP
jgi:ketosteroid isomerase-like protein